MTNVKRIWVIDDDDIHQFFAKKSLEQLETGSVVVPFLFGETALMALKNGIAAHEDLPDIIFLDINMPQMDGWEFLEEFRKFSGAISPKITIYIVSSSIADVDRQRARSYPEITDFFIKPITPNSLRGLFDTSKVPG